MSAERTTNQNKVIVSVTSGHLAIDTAPDVHIVEGKPVPFRNWVGSERIQQGTVLTRIQDDLILTSKGQLGPPSEPPHAGVGKTSGTNAMEAVATSYSRDVIIEGGHAVRSFDTTEQNHGNTVGMVIPKALGARTGKLSLAEAIDVICTALARYQGAIAKRKVDAENDLLDAQAAKRRGEEQLAEGNEALADAKGQQEAAKKKLEEAKKSGKKADIAAAQKELKAADAAVARANKQITAANRAIAAADKQIAAANTFSGKVDDRLREASRITPEHLLAIGIHESGGLDPTAYFGKYDRPPPPAPTDLGAYSGAAGLFGILRTASTETARVLTRMSYTAPTDPLLQRGLDVYPRGRDGYTDPAAVARARYDPQTNADIAALTLIDRVWAAGDLQTGISNYGTGAAYGSTMMQAAQKLRDQAREAAAAGGTTDAEKDALRKATCKGDACTCAELRDWAASLSDEEQTKVRDDMQAWIHKQMS